MRFAVTLTVCVTVDGWSTEPKRVRPDMTRPTEVVLDYWDSARKYLLGDPKLIQRLLEYDKDNMDPRIVDTITASFINNPLFNPEVIRKVTCSVVEVA